MTLDRTGMSATKSRLLGAMMKAAGGSMVVSEEMAEELHWVIVKAYTHGIAIQSNFAREHAAQVAAAASLGLITTSLMGDFGRTWRVTELGLRLANERINA